MSREYRCQIPFFFLCVQPLLEISIKGPTNCVEVAVEALRRLGRGDTVRDALNLVKKTSPHRRLNHQRRQQEQELREKEDRSQPKPEKYNGEKGGSDRKPGAMSGSNQAQPSAGNGAVAAPAPASTLSRKPVKEASARSGEGGVPGGRKTSNGGDGSGNRGTNSAGQGQNGGDKEHVDEASSTRGNDDGQRHLKTEESRDGGGGPSGRPVESGGSREGSGGSGNRGRVGGTNEQSVAGESNGSQDRQPQPEASKLSQAVTEQGGSKQVLSFSKRAFRQEGGTNSRYPLYLPITPSPKKRLLNSVYNGILDLMYSVCVFFCRGR